MNNKRLPLLHPMEERAGERRRLGFNEAPLSGSLPVRSSRGESERIGGFQIRAPANDGRCELPPEGLCGFEPLDLGQASGSAGGC
jgi:hypothetical protein